MNCVPVTLNGQKKNVCVGTALSELFALSMPCGRHGKCGKCKVRAWGALSEISVTEKELLTKDELDNHVRLACCTKVCGECFAESIFDAPDTKNVLTVGDAFNITANPMFHKYGVAIDIGTTTLAAKLFAQDGSLLAEYGTVNPQVKYGADVISRIEASISGNAIELSEILAFAIDDMINLMATKAKISVQDIDGAVITGNTVMLYLLTKSSPEALSHAPFEMKRTFGETVSSSALGLTSFNATVYLPPCISAFIGADTVCALLSSDICSSKNTVMLADIGTNGETVLWHNGSLTACSTAAGPAFEGVGISMGMCGNEGAIDSVSLLNGKLHSHVIGNIPPKGICGSGLIDAVAVLLEDEVIDETGLMEEDAEILAPIKLTKNDIRMVQLAKSAICAGMKTLMHEAKIAEGQIDSLYIAGGFGNYLNKFSAARIGLIPYSLLPKIKNIGNASLSGAAMLLLNKDLWKDAKRISKNTATVGLSDNDFFAEAYMREMLFPKS